MVEPCQPAYEEGVMAGRVETAQRIDQRIKTCTLWLEALGGDARVIGKLRDEVLAIVSQEGGITASAVPMATEDGA